MREDHSNAGVSRMIPRPDRDQLSKTNCQGGGGDCDESSSAGCGSQRDRDDDGSTLFDSLSRQWVKVDNFAFAQSDNHFSSRDTIQ